MTAPAVRPAAAARYLLLGATVFLALGGLLMIFSASSASDFLKFGDSYYHVERQAIGTGRGHRHAQRRRRVTRTNVHDGDETPMVSPPS